MAALRGGDLLALREHGQFQLLKATPTPALTSLVYETRRGHVSMLNDIAAEITSGGLQEVPLGTALVRALERISKRRAWAPPSLARSFGKLAGAMSGLPFYAKTTWRLTTSQDPIFKAAQASADQLSRSYYNRDPVAVGVDTMWEVAQNASQEAQCLTLAWAVGARFGDIQQLQKQDITTTRVDTGWDLSITYRRGKTVTRIGPYTAHSHLRQSPAAEALIQRLATLPTKAFPFPPPRRRKFQDKARATLRAAGDGSLTLRSIRRGALQTLALAGTPIDVLMTFAGHTNQTSTKRYLIWGKLFGTQMRQGRAAAGNLYPQPHADPARH